MQLPAPASGRGFLSVHLSRSLVADRGGQNGRTLLPPFCYRRRSQSISSIDGAPSPGVPLPWSSPQSHSNCTRASTSVRQFKNCDSASIWSSCFPPGKPRYSIRNSSSHGADLGRIKDPASSFAVSPYMRVFLSTTGRLATMPVIPLRLHCAINGEPDAWSSIKIAVGLCFCASLKTAIQSSGNSTFFRQTSMR